MERTQCIFCRIAAGELPTELVYQDEEVVAFRDIHPQAPKHLLVIPKAHIPTLAEASPLHDPLMGKLIEAANEVARAEGIAQGGYRVVINVGPDSGQEVMHLHLHVLGGKRLGRLC